VDRRKRYSVDEAHEMFAKTFNGRVWELLEKKERSSEEDEELLLAQSASCYHWRHVGTVVHEQRGHWLFSRVYADLQRPTEALDHAEKCMVITKANPESMKDFDIAYAHEALARAHALLGNEQISKDHFQQAYKLGNAIADDEDKEIFMGDLNAGDWQGISQ
jgi:tetratricopeptide (TPR) repeat protein